MLIRVILKRPTRTSRWIKPDWLWKLWCSFASFTFHDHNHKDSAAAAPAQCKVNPGWETNYRFPHLVWKVNDHFHVLLTLMLGFPWSFQPRDLTFFSAATLKIVHSHYNCDCFVKTKPSNKCYRTVALVLRDSITCFSVKTLCDRWDVKLICPYHYYFPFTLRPSYNVPWITV